MVFYDTVTTILGVPNSFAGELILYTLSAILFLVVFDASLRIIYLLIEKFSW